MKYDHAMGQIRVSAEELCHFVLHRREGLSSFEARRRADRETIPSVLSFLGREASQGLAVYESVACGSLTYLLSGEIDLLFYEDGEPILGFVRAVPARDFNKKSGEEYTSYIRCCAFLYGKSEAREKVRAAVFVKNAEGEEIRRETLSFDTSALSVGVGGYLSALACRANLLVEHETNIRPAAAEVVFPYGEIREGQDELIHRGYTVIKQGKRLFAQAPTGIGKTISTLYPAVRAFGKGLCDKIFYLTAKSQTAREAYLATKRLFEAGAHLRAIMLTAKEQMCPMEHCGGKYCNPKTCAFVRGYADRSEAAINELISRQHGYYADIIKEVAAKHGVCPYELSLDLSELCDVIICDYNYLFDPMVYLRRYFEEPGAFGEYVFLVDEAHNLVDRARSMYSVALNRRATSEFLEGLPEDEKTLREAATAFEIVFGDLRALCRDTLHTDGAGREIGYYVSRNRIETVCAEATKLGNVLSGWLRANREHPLYDLVDGYYSSVRKYLCVLDYYDDKFMSYVELCDEDITLTLSCMDPSEVLDSCMRRGRASILFSATLTPTSYFSDVLGGGRDSVCMELPSPYKPENLCLAAVDTISTRYEDRDDNCRRVATLIAAAVSPKAGNYIAYFPSYSYLQKVHEAFTKKYPKVKTIVQSRGMSRAEREAFIGAFREDEGKMRIGFCVLGGSFSEGVDLPGSRLIGSIIIGVGLPGFSSERNLMRDYFETRYENGFDYAYTFPGMNGVLQAAGRVIRREEDRGIVVLIDDRYGTPTYQKLFPSHWKHLKYAGNSASLAEIARKFWENSKK